MSHDTPEINIGYLGIKHSEELTTKWSIEKNWTVRTSLVWQNMVINLCNKCVLVHYICPSKFGLQENEEDPVYVKCIQHILKKRLKEEQISCGLEWGNIYHLSAALYCKYMEGSI